MHPQSEFNAWCKWVLFVVVVQGGVVVEVVAQSWFGIDTYVASDAIFCTDRGVGG